MYEQGKGVSRDYIKAVEWYQKSAERGNGSAQNDMGRMYEKGLGVSRDYAKAAEWYQKAISRGNPDAMCNLGYMYEYGLGVSKDNYRAAELYFFAAKRGSLEAKKKWSLIHLIFKTKMFTKWFFKYFKNLYRYISSKNKKKKMANSNIE